MGWTSIDWLDLRKYSLYSLLRRNILCSIFEFRFIENWYEITGVSTFDVYAAGECVAEVSGVRISLGRQTFLGEVDLGYYVIR